jgi:hypothetical protein
MYRRGDTRTNAGIDNVTLYNRLERKGAIVIIGEARRRRCAVGVAKLDA